MSMVGWIFRVVLHGLQSSIVPTSLSFQFILVSGNTPLTFAQCVADLGEVMDGIADALSTNQSDAHSWHNYSVARLDGTEVSGIVALPNAPHTGLVTGDALPSQTALVLRFPTGHSRRRLLKYIPGLAESQGTASGNFSGATTAAFIATAADWLVPIEATEAAWQYMYKTPNEALDPLIVYPISVTASQIPKVQTRRRF